MGALTASLFAQSCYERLFTLQSRPGISAQEVVNNISEECGFTVITEDSYAKRKLYTTRLGQLDLKKVSLYRLLDIVLKDHNIDYTIDGDVLKIRYLITKTFHLDYVNTRRKSKSVTDASVDIGLANITGEGSAGTSANSGHSGGDINSISAEDEFDFWKNVQSELYNIVNRPGDEYKAPKPVVNRQAGLVTITGTPKQIQRVENYIKKIEGRLHKEVLIDVSILAVMLNDNITTGIDWSKFGASLEGGAGIHRVGSGRSFSDLHIANSVSTLIDTSISMSGIIDFLKKEGNVVTLSNPKILTLNNQPAIISIGDNINFNVPTSITISSQGDLGEKSYTPSSIFVGILLNITPEITENGDVILRINPSISELRNPDDLYYDKTKQTFREIAPDTKEKKISTVVRVKDGSTLILGGLISNTRNFTINGVPVLKDVPVFGNLFRSNHKENQRFELVFVLKTIIIGDNETDLGLKDLGYEKLGYGK